MPFSLPTTPRSNAMDVAIKSYGADFSSPFGGSNQRASRPGDRMMVNVSLPPMEAWQALPWMAAKAKALSDTVIFSVAQPGVPVMTFGAPKVRANTAAGTTLPINFATNRQIINAGRLFSVVRGAQRYLHMVVADQEIADTGECDLLIRPALRTAYVAGDTIEFADPKIQGFIQGTEAGWAVNVMAHYGLNFQIIEDR